MRKIHWFTVLSAFLMSMLLSNTALAATPRTRPAPRPAPWVNQSPADNVGTGAPAPSPAPSGTNGNSEQPFDSAAALEQLRRQYPGLQIPSDPSQVQWVAPAPDAQAGVQVVQGGQEDGADFLLDENGEMYEEDAQYYEQLMRDARDAKIAQHWIEVQEDLTLRDIDNKAMALVKEFAAAKHAIPPMPGVNGAVSYNFGDHIPKIICRPNRVTNISLQPGEKVTAVHAGDTTRWQFNPGVSGNGENETVHIVIKPLVPDISTNLIVMTDRRTYNVDLVSSNSEYIPSAHFSYPDDTLQAWGAFVKQTQANKQDELLLSEGANVSPEDLYFGYEIIRGKNVPWKPVRVFDDGMKTYIEMPTRYKSLEAPVLLYYEGRQQKLVNYRVKDRFYVVDRLMTGKAALIAGQHRVVIQRKNDR